MRLIPDIQINGHRISMQDPYTINNAVIINIEMNNVVVYITARYNRQLDKIYSINIEKFNDLIRRSYNFYINETFVDENGCISNHPRNINAYINAIRMRNPISPCINFDRVYQRLIAQRRLPLEENFVSSSSLESNRNNRIRHYAL